MPRAVPYLRLKCHNNAYGMADMSAETTPYVVTSLTMLRCLTCCNNFMCSYNAQCRNCNMVATITNMLRWLTCHNNSYVIRYKCGNCRSFDLCAACEPQSTTIHDPRHIFLKIVSPLDPRSSYTARARIYFWRLFGVCRR